jgi:outer membrane receptor protein involved in Fe transport
MKFEKIFVLLTLVPVAAAAQQRPDSLPLLHLNALTVTAERASAAINNSVNAVSRLERAELRVRPLRNLADAIQQAPGFAFVDFDGNGGDPQAIVRGFYGGGEADYVQVLVDGRPLNALENGRINWDLIPLSSIESIEIVRGASSAAWGDAALGGVINVLTRQAGVPYWRGSISSGTFGVARAAGSALGQLGAMPVSAFADFGRTDGFRDNAERTTSTFGFTFGANSQLGWTLTALGDWREFSEPGALTENELEADRRESASFHRFDRTDERLHRLTVEKRSALGAATLHTALTGELRNSDRIRTVRLSPAFADTKDRDLDTRRLFGTAELALDGLFSERDDVLLGVDASYGRIKSEYFDFAQGPAPAYAAVHQRGDLSSNASGNRGSAAAFGRYALQATAALRLTAGGRLDWLRDSFDTDATSQNTDPRTHTVFSPRVGANLRYLESERQNGHVYANVTRAFKAATPDQLYDRRLIPVPDPPFQITFSNADLEPQKGVSYEAGVYHQAVLAPGTLAADLSVSVYQIDLRDEIDFDINTFSYKNLGKSRHRGVEAGLNLRGPHTIGGFANYTLQAPTARNGENSGKYLKAIPRHFLVAGVSAGSAVSGSVSATHSRGVFLDDGNTITLPNWTRVDARVAYRRRQLQLSVDALNLFDREYNTTGFPDAGGAGVYYYPAAGRTVQVGLSWGR